MRTDLLKIAFDAALAAPEFKFNLDLVLDEDRACGTIGCALGWATLNPQIQAAGLTFLPTVGGRGTFTLTRDGKTEGYSNFDFELAAMDFFEISEHDALNLFCVAGDSEHDENYPGDADAATDKQLFANRVARFRKFNNF